MATMITTGVGGGINVVSNGQITAAPIGANYGHSISYSGTYGIPTNVVVQSDSPDLPPISISTSDENGRAVCMTLTPESGISNSDTMKLMMLMTAMTVAPTSFNALAYVKKNNLERHFKYS